MSITLKTYAIFNFYIKDKKERLQENQSWMKGNYEMSFNILGRSFHISISEKEFKLHFIQVSARLKIYLI